MFIEEKKNKIKEEKVVTKVAFNRYEKQFWNVKI